jgi:long-chain acyl-CoA synthetase
MGFITRKTITETFLARVRESSNEVGFLFKPTYSELGTVGQWKNVTYQEFFDQCKLVSLGLIGIGVKARDKVVILSNTRFEWSLCDMAILGAGAITVPIYASNTPDDVVYICNHAEARIAIVEDDKQLQKILDKRAEKADCLPYLEKIVVLDPAAMRLTAQYGSLAKNVMTLQALNELGKRESTRDPARFEKNLSAAKPDDLITICYTSGTTGIPKGVMITHDNIMSVLEDCVQALGKFVSPKGEVILSFLPFSHIFGKVESLATYAFGWKQAYAENLDKLMGNIADIRPTILFSVPRIFEKAFTRIHATVETGSPVAKALFQWAFEAGKKYYEAIWAKKSPGIADTVQYQAAKRVIFGKISQKFGGRLRFAVCGGAPLPREIGEFFQIVGIQILEGYGLTETCAPVAVNTPDDVRFGVVGRPLPEVTIRIAEDGEILVKSRKVFQSYFKMPEETAHVVQNGWFHTGDIGHIDSDGFLHITDRKKDLIVTSGGKNIAPQKIENIAKSQKFISQFVVHGDRRNFLTALVTLDRDQIIRHANEHQILYSEYAELIKNPKILALVQRIIDEVNKELASFETVKKFVILPRDFTVEGGELTPSLKVKRSFINKQFKAELDSMYGDSTRVPLDS